jgi:very-short-patch-repair endonuclease
LLPNTIRQNDSDNRSRSKPHRRIESILEEININFDTERFFSPYTVDIYLPEWHLAIEVDGPYHSASKDKIRDAWLFERYGLLLLRLDVKIWRNKTYLQDKIIQFLEEHADSLEERKIIWRTQL